MRVDVAHAQSLIPCQRLLDRKVPVSHDIGAISSESVVSPTPGSTPLTIEELTAFAVFVPRIGRNWLLCDQAPPPCGKRSCAF